MMPARAHTFTVGGPTAEAVTVEVDVRPGLPAFSIIGLSDAAVRETRERVQAAILNCGYEFPVRRITANIAPPHIQRLGPCTDLAVACALLAASGQIPRGALESHALYGRLALDGRIQSCPGPLAIARLTCERGLTTLVLAIEDRPATAAVEDLRIVAAVDLRAAVRALTAFAALADGSALTQGRD